MEALIQTTAARVGLLAAMLFFLTALLTGCWKYFRIRASDKAEAPYYVNIAHRAALLYSFAAVLLTILASLSAFSSWINVLAITLPLIYFAIAIARYIQLGLADRTDNQHLEPASPGGELVLLLSLMVAEIGGFVVLCAGTLVTMFG